MKKMIVAFCFILLYSSIHAQITGPWVWSHYNDPITDFSMSLKGQPKKWEYFGEKGVTRTITYDQSGKVTSDTYTGTVQSFVPPSFLVIKKKRELEKAYTSEEVSSSNAVFNHLNQLVRSYGKNDTVENTFYEDGRIRSSLKKRSYDKIGAWNSMHHENPTYTYTVNEGELMIFHYNKQKQITSIECYNSDPFNNLKMVYKRDQHGNIIKDMRYDHYNISVGNMPDEFFNTITKRPFDIEKFSIESYFENYWSQGRPAVNTYEYDSLNRKIAYHSFGFKHGLSFTAQWEYEDDLLKKEIHYDVYHDRISRILKFDEVGNVISDHKTAFRGQPATTNTIRITYY